MDSKVYVKCWGRDRAQEILVAQYKNSRDLWKVPIIINKLACVCVMSDKTF